MDSAAKGAGMGTAAKEGGSAALSEAMKGGAAAPAPADPAAAAGTATE
jgi:hypothetical protein